MVTLKGYLEEELNQRMMSKQREAQFMAFIGKPGTGKTTLMKNFIEGMVNKKRRRAIIVDPDGQEQAWYRTSNGKDIPLYKSADQIPAKFKGIVVVEYQASKKDEPGTMEILQKRLSSDLKSTILVLDDANFYCDGQPEEALKQILARKRQYQCDIFTTAHSLSRVPKFFFTFITNYVFKKVLSFSEERKSTLKEAYDPLKKVMMEVNHHPDKYYWRFVDPFGN